MTNPVLTRNTTVLRGAGATVQSIALITLLYLGFVVSATMRLFADYDMVTRAVEMGVDAKYEPYYAFALTVTLIWLYLGDTAADGKEQEQEVNMKIQRGGA